MKSNLIYMFENHLNEKIAKDYKFAVSNPRYGYFVSALNNLDEKIVFHSDVHGITHIERVCFLGLSLCDELNTSEEDTKLVLTACAFHDIGRQSEFIDKGHGKRAADVVDIYVDYKDEDLQILKAAIEAHSESDCFMDSIIDKYSIHNKKRAKYISQILKDADGLDRVRISDLDSGHLRFKESLKLIDMAENLFWFYH